MAVRGGFDVAPVLGSLSSDTLARIGPDALATGDVLALRAPAAGAASGRSAAISHLRETRRSC